MPRKANRNLTLPTMSSNSVNEYLMSFLLPSVRANLLTDGFLCMAIYEFVVCSAQTLYYIIFLIDFFRGRKVKNSFLRDNCHKINEISSFRRLRENQKKLICFFQIELQIRLEIKTYVKSFDRFVFPGLPPLWESGLGGLVGRLGRTTQNPWADC